MQFTDAHYTDPAQVEKILAYYSGAARNLDLIPQNGARMLEIGAGLAWMSRACKAIDPTVLTIAQDVSAECADTCPWVDHYFVGTVDAIPDRGPYQMVSLTHVIEHLANPASMLRTISALVQPGGAVFITAPFRPSGWRRGDAITAWRDYSYLHVPAHITYFSRQWFELQAASHFSIAHWDASHENGQAFELVLRRK
ncbi:MAG: class I SAM-dependent methyltransferase [Proteobacteria bacterium]|nr:class I SAM-dependent methyltransferase [Pseudomonadota bacterium]